MGGYTPVIAGAVFVNPGSGPDDTDLDDLRQRFAGHRVEEIDPADLADAIRAALVEGCDFIGVAGGDGTIHAAAEVLVGTGVPVLPIPAGTRNHFARDVGVNSLDAAEKAVGGREIVVDVGRVNGRVFVNNSSIGLYPKIVVRREIHQRRLRKGVAILVAAYEQLREAHTVAVEIDGVTHRAWMVFVGNCLYGEGLFDLADRECLDGNVLDLRIVRAERRLSRLRVVASVMFGRLGRSKLIVTERTTAVVVHLDRSRVEVALDGEVERLDTPLCYESVPGALRVLVP